MNLENNMLRKRNSYKGLEIELLLYEMPSTGNPTESVTKFMAAQRHQQGSNKDEKYTYF